MGATILPMGPMAVLVEGIAQPAAYAEQVRRLADAGALHAVVDVVPAAATVLVTFGEPPDLDAFAAALDTVRVTDSPTPGGDVVDVPTRYDGADLATVAAATGLTVGEVVAVHASAEYVVSFCGFAPGFAYLAGLPAVLHLPRRSSPRQRVPRGSVAIAAGYAAVYPRESPGGWHLLGSTPLALFDAGRRPPALLAPGTRVRFVPA